MRPDILLEDVSKVYEEGNVGLHRTTIRLTSNQMIGIVGPNGAGKSTLIHLIAGVLRPSTGRVVTSISSRKKLAWVSQFTSIDWFLSVRDNVLLGAKLGGIRGKNARQQSADALSCVGLDQKSLLFPDQLSGGEQRRLQVARAIAQSPDILLLDEPTVGLDPIAAEQLMSFLKTFPPQNKLVILSSHDLSLIDDYVDSILFISNGNVSLENQQETIDSSYYCMKIEYSNLLDHDYLDLLIQKGAEITSKNPLEFKIRANSEELQVLLRLLVEKNDIVTLEVRPQTLYGRFFEKFQADR